EAALVLGCQVRKVVADVADTLGCDAGCLQQFAVGRHLVERVLIDELDADLAGADVDHRRTASGDEPGALAGALPPAEAEAVAHVELLDLEAVGAVDDAAVGQDAV